ncbi:MAG: M3 family metallopeptidase [Bacteroidales bacterium]|nr:M3 family metallopeptidase [Bacteroidales bacterium]
MNNPLLEDWNTDFGLPPFEKIEVTHFLPAIKKSVEDAKDQINSIAENPEQPGFENTVVALDHAGIRLDEIASVLFNLNSAETSSELQSAAMSVSPLLSRFSNDITLNRKLFKRIEELYDKKDSLGLSGEQEMLLVKTYRSFIKGGAGLDENHRSRFREINEELASLTLKFEENVLEETNSFYLQITDKEDLEGLPAGIIETAAEEAAASGREGWVFTLHIPSYLPFMQYSAKRHLREKMFRAYSSRAYRKQNNDNREIVKKIVNLRTEKAKLLGYDKYASLVLEDRMLNTPEKVTGFLENLHTESHRYALRDLEEVQEFAAKNGHNGKIERWDWAYYAEKLKMKKYQIDDEVLRPYFELEKAGDAIFRLASDLYGLSFEKSEKLNKYHEDVRAYIVKDNNNDHLAILYLDFFPRKGKSGGAWMTAYRDQYKDGSKDTRPVISVVTNFSKPSSKRPALLTHTELTTFMHEFGHALHGMLSKCTYRSISGTNVSRDFVELPSQIMENWAYEKEWLRSWSSHYETGQELPDYLIDKIKEAMTFNEGYASNRQLGFGFLDMAWHSMDKEFKGSVDSFESEAMSKTNILDPVEGSNMSCSFGHLFAGGYAAGYYGYKWSEVLDADAFSLFRKKGIFDKETAESFRKNILEKGGSNEPMDLYKKFRGKEPTIDAYIERSGFRNGV